MSTRLMCFAHASGMKQWNHDATPGEHPTKVMPTKTRMTAFPTGSHFKSNSLKLILAFSEMATTAGCFNFRSTEMA